MKNAFRNINLGCHGIPERCLMWHNRRMRICARCFGSNIGHISAIILFLLGILPSWQYALLFISIMLADWMFQELSGVMSTNARRLFTGVLGGLGVGALIWSSIGYFIYRILPIIA